VSASCEFEPCVALGLNLVKYNLTTGPETGVHYTGWVTQEGTQPWSSLLPTPHIDPDMISDLMNFNRRGTGLDDQGAHPVKVEGNRKVTGETLEQCVEIGVGHLLGFRWVVAGRPLHKRKLMEVIRAVQLASTQASIGVSRPLPLSFYNTGLLKLAQTCLNCYPLQQQTSGSFR
jgi:hypothetical protein